MCVFSYKQKFCLCCKLKRGAQLVILFDTFMTIQIVLLYAGFMFMGRERFRDIMGLFTDLNNREVSEDEL